MEQIFCFAVWRPKLNVVLENFVEFDFTVNLLQLLSLNQEEQEV